MVLPPTEATVLGSSASWPGFAGDTRCGSAPSTPGSPVDVLPRAARKAGGKTGRGVVRCFRIVCPCTLDAIKSGLFRCGVLRFRSQRYLRDTMIEQ